MAGSGLGRLAVPSTVLTQAESSAAAAITVLAALARGIQRMQFTELSKPATVTLSLTRDRSRLPVMAMSAPRRNLVENQF
ncbi:MAG: hypothetical protein ACPGVG_09545, partial [Mycobacterium sp.]